MPVGALSQSSTSEGADAEVSNREAAPVKAVSGKEKKKGSFVCPCCVMYVYIVLVLVNFDSNLTKCTNKLDILYLQSRLPWQ
jgi:hypothetical protein